MPEFENPYESKPTADSPGTKYNKWASQLRMGLDYYFGWKMTNKQEAAFATVIEFFYRVFFK